MGWIKQKKNSDTVRPDVEMKGSPIFPKVAQKVATAVCSKVLVLQNRQKLCTHFGYFSKKICHQELSKNAHSGHTLSQKNKKVTWLNSMCPDLAILCQSFDNFWDSF